jgi:hypothetical protein
MAQGVIDSLAKHSDEKTRNNYSQDFLIVLINSLVKFTEE